MTYSKVQGHPNLIRDENSKAIINISTDQLLQAKRLKENVRQKQTKIESLENRINNLEGKLDKIIQYLEDK